MYKILPFPLNCACLSQNGLQSKWRHTAFPKFVAYIDITF